MTNTLNPDTLNPDTPTTDTPTTDTLPSAAAPFVLGRDEGAHRHFLNHVATTKLAAAAGASMNALEFTMPRSFGPPLHVHDSEDELMVILEGEIAFRSGDTEFVGGAGATVWLPHGVPHSFQVLSEEARCVTVTASSEGQPVFENMVRELGAETAEPLMPMPVDIDPGAVAEACGRNGITVLGPPPAPLD